MVSTVTHTPLSSHSFIQEDSLSILERVLCNFPEGFVVLIEQGICMFPIVSQCIELYFYAVSLYTCIYVLNVYINMRRTVVLFICKVYIYGTECKIIYEVSSCFVSNQVYLCCHA